MTSAGSVTISGVVVLQSPRPVDPQKGPRNIIFDANFCIVEGSQTATMALLRYFASNEMAYDIQKMADKPFQKAFIVANIASVTPGSITTFAIDFEPSDYAFVGDIQHLIPFDGDVNMQTNPYITVTGNVSRFDTDDRTFTMTPTQYVILTHSTSPFPIHAHFADSASKKRWGADGPKVAIGSNITLGGSLERVVRNHDIDRALQFAQIEVANIAYLGARPALAPSPSLERAPTARRRWNWDDLHSSSQQSQSSQGASITTTTLSKRKRDDDSDNDDFKREKTADDNRHDNTE